MPAERKERRAHPRAHLAAQVEVDSQGRSFLAIIRNISAGGMQIFTGNPAPVGERLQLAFYLPESPKKIRVNAVVRNVLPDSAMGVQFEDLGAEDAAEIRAFVQRTFVGENEK
jgi:uncharacterized protein (TIGR02266 family)